MYVGLSVWLSRLPGGLLHSNIGGCALFAATCGSSVATAATIGTVALPALEQRGYDRARSLGSIAAGGTLGILIPPSVAMLIYGSLTNNSVGQLFIAGIIHSIVPQAEIHLIEVLNQNGVGDYHAFNAGMQKAINDFKDPSRKLVINCSWMLDFPVDEHHCHHAKVAASGLSDPDIEFEEAVRLYVEKNEQAIAFNLEAAFDRSDQIGRGTIAAAGNDGYDDEMNSIHIRPKARYPAALTTVLGVGALPTTLDKFTSGTLSGKYKVSDFSNRSDREDSSGTHPPKNGFATLGGEPGERKGILGLYLGEFPDGRRNTSKWAWWSGTSFATPLLTAAVASILSNKYQPVATTRQAIQKVREYLVIGSTDVKDEEAVPLTQC